jgi:hypothetical protein
MTNRCGAESKTLKSAKSLSFIFMKNTKSFAFLVGPFA